MNKNTVTETAFNGELNCTKFKLKLTLTNADHSPYLLFFLKCALTFVRDVIKVYGDNNFCNTTGW